MSESEVVFGRDKTGPAWRLALSIFLGVLLVTWAVLTFWLWGVAPEYSMGLPGACAVGCLIWATVSVRRLKDQEPKLIIDQRGITDNRAVAGPRFIPWEVIQSMDYQYETQTESINFIPLPTKTRARILAYCLEPGNDDAQEIEIDIAGLDRRPGDVRGEIHRAWTRFNLHRGAT